MINTGLYLLNKKIIKTLKDNKRKDFDVFREHKNKNLKLVFIKFYQTR